MLLDTLDALKGLRAFRTVVLAAPEHEGVAVLRSIVPSQWDVVAQRGDDLGARLQNALRRLGALGDPVAIVSSDSPTMPIAPLASALDSFIGRPRALIGPCDDGGYYLIGLTEQEPRMFHDIAWSTPVVLEQTRRRCVDLGLPWEELPTVYDVDTPTDVDRFRAELETSPHLAPRCAAFFRSTP
jgi:glycosyltransferase A (GT-A) superfamily protein (DUF2064 family)